MDFAITDRRDPDEKFSGLFKRTGRRKLASNDSNWARFKEMQEELERLDKKWELFSYLYL